MKSCYIFKIESLSCVDGEGLRVVVFLSGCNSRCGYCHNPESWNFCSGEEYTSLQLAKKLKKFAPYIKNGGITFSGGEPILHAGFILEVIDSLQDSGFNYALETAGGALSPDIVQVIKRVDHIILDVKALCDEDYLKFTRSQTLSETLTFLSALHELSKKIWVRYVVVKNYNDTVLHIQSLKKILQPYGIERIQLLPFSKLCNVKYEERNILFPFINYETPSLQDIKKLEDILK